MRRKYRKNYQIGKGIPFHKLLNIKYKKQKGKGKIKASANDKRRWKNLWKGVF